MGLFDGYVDPEQFDSGGGLLGRLLALPQFQGPYLSNTGLDPTSVRPQLPDSAAYTRALDPEPGRGAGRSATRVADGANDNNPIDAQCTTASYDCLSNSYDNDYAEACRKAYLVCREGGSFARSSGIPVITNFPDGGRVILHPDGKSQYIPSRNPPTQPR